MIEDIRSFNSLSNNNSGSLVSKPPQIVAKKNDARFASPMTQYLCSSEIAQTEGIPESATPPVACKPMPAEMAMRVPV